jgi:hypothetical protein
MIIQCGDFGYWPKFPIYYNKNSVKNRDFPIYWIDGNHEDHESIGNLKTNEISPNVFYMKRGSTMRLSDGRNILFMGGGLSIDRKQRTPGKDWFPEESITQKDILNLPDEKVDIVISHTCPTDFDAPDWHEDFDHDSSRDALNYILNRYKPKTWYFAHMHTFKQGYTNGCSWTCLSNIESSKRWWIKLNE